MRERHQGTTELEVEQYRALVEREPTMIWRTDVSGSSDFFNATWLAFTGRSLEQELGTGWAEGVHPDDLVRCTKARREHFALGRAFEIEFRLRRFDGVYRYVSDWGVPYGASGGFVGTCVDVDERRALAASSSESDFFGMSLDNLCVATFDGYFKSVNLSWTRTLGWTAEELMSRPSLEFVHPDDRAATMAARRLLQVGSTLDLLVNRYLCKDGSYRWFEWRSVGHPERELVYAAARDVTEQKLNEARLAEAKELQQSLQRQLMFADRMASVGTLAAGVAHELNNPLAYVTGNIAMILEELQNPTVQAALAQTSELHSMVLEAKTGAERIRKIVLGLKTFSRAEEERRAVIDVHAVLELCIDMTFNEIRHRARLVRNYAATPLIYADEARLAQVFINLLVNAAQALSEGDSEANEIRIATSSDAAGRAVIEIQDTGHGIPEALLERIFEPFFTTKAVGTGTGLGLSICRNIVLALGGELTVTSTERRGTTFRIALPAAEGPVSAGPVAAVRSVEPHKQSSTGCSVLIVDDEPAIGVILRRVLRGHEVTVVTRAKEALKLLKAGMHFDVILSDIMMPEMSGMGFYDELKRSFPDLVRRVVFISGGAFTATAKAFVERVPNEVLAKPFDVERVRAAISRFSAPERQRA